MIYFKLFVLIYAFRMGMMHLPVMHFVDRVACEQSASVIANKIKKDSPLEVTTFCVEAERAK